MSVAFQFSCIGVVGLTEQKRVSCPLGIFVEQRKSLLSFRKCCASVSLSLFPSLVVIVSFEMACFQNMLLPVVCIAIIVFRGASTYECKYNISKCNPPIIRFQQVLPF